MDEFSVSPATVQWLATGYMLINGILIPASAFFIQRFTNRHKNKETPHLHGQGGVFNYS